MGLLGHHGMCACLGGRSGALEVEVSFVRYAWPHLAVALRQLQTNPSLLLGNFPESCIIEACHTKEFSVDSAKARP